MNVEALLGLAISWRQDAERFRALGQDAPARMSDAHADELESRVRAWQLESLTIEQAAEESGDAYSTLQRKLATGALPNAGRRGAPRIRRRDLFGSPDSPEAEGPDLADHILTRRLG